MVDGIYSDEDVAAVKRFQKKYSDQILRPWGHSTPTGNVLKTTIAKINLVSCAKCPYFNTFLKKGDQSLEVVRIKDFLNLVFAPTSGYPTKGIPLSTNFDKKTEDKLKEYQTIYKDMVLKPW